MELNIKNSYEAISSAWDTTTLMLWDILSYSEYTLLYFYPADNTPGCTLENKGFSCLKDEFKKRWVTLIGVSKNSIESHRKFISEHMLEVDLISDPELILHKELGAYGEKNNYGKIVTWVIRSTFLLDTTGKIIQEWRNVRATGHAEKVLRELSV